MARIGTAAILTDIASGTFRHETDALPSCGDCSIADLGIAEVLLRPPVPRLLPSSSPHPPITRRENAAPDDARAERPLLLDLSEAPHDALAAGVRDGWPNPRNGAARIVIDLGERRTLPHDAIDELLITHRALRRAGGRCALVVGPALAAQLSLAYPDGSCGPRTAMSRSRRSHRVRRQLQPRSRSVRAAGACTSLSGELDLASLPALEAVLTRAHAAARERREIVFDLTQLAFVDLVALRAITTAVVRCDLAGARTRVTGAQTQVRRLVRHLGWQEQLAGIDDASPAPLRTPSQTIAELTPRWSAWPASATRHTRDRPMRRIAARRRTSAPLDAATKGPADELAADDDRSVAPERARPRHAMSPAAVAAWDRPCMPRSGAIRGAARERARASLGDSRRWIGAREREPQ